jgi:hypothetical protein
VHFVSIDNITMSIDCSTSSDRRSVLPSTSLDLSEDRNDSILSSCLRPLQCLFSRKKEEQASVETTSPQASSSWMQKAQYAVSLTLLGLTIALCTAGILAKQTPVAEAACPTVALVLMWFLIFWLGILEGGQGSLVGLQPVDSTQFQDSHPYAYACTQLAHTGDNLNRFIVGRQFLVVLVVFMLNMTVTVVDDFDVPGVPRALMAGMVGSGVGVMLITVMLGQLAAEVNATNCMLDFINNSIVWVTTVICLAIEESGLLHSVYLVQCFFSTESMSKESTNKTMRQKIWYWGRVAVSTIFLACALSVTCAALWHGETTMYPGLTTMATFALFFGLVCFLGLLEAIQIAAFAVVKLPAHIVAESPAADANCQLVFKGRNFKAVLIGRQICVTTSMFLLARITTTNVDPNDLADTSTTMSTVLNLPAGIQDFFNTGLPGALITTIVASLWWRILAASFPIAFMGNTVVYWTIRLCLFLESTGVFSAAWLLADGIKWMSGLQPDETYLKGDKIDHHDLELNKCTSICGSQTNLTVSTGRSDSETSSLLGSSTRSNGSETSSFLSTSTRSNGSDDFATYGSNNIVSREDFNTLSDSSLPTF